MKSNGLTLGVLGGMGPAAAAEFLRILSLKSPASCDQEHPRVILYSDTSIPNRTDYLMGKGIDPSPFLLDGLNTLLDWGADLLAVTCNTSHYFIDSFPQKIRSRLISIVDETIRVSKEKSPSGAWLTATLGTMNTHVFQNHATCFDYMFKTPDDNMLSDIHRVTDLVKANELEEASLLFGNICNVLWTKRKIPIVCACTELPIAYNYAGLPAELCVSSIEALADGCVRELFKSI